MPVVSLFVNSVKQRLIHLWGALCACPEPMDSPPDSFLGRWGPIQANMLPSHEHVPCLIVLKVKANLYKVCTI